MLHTFTSSNTASCYLTSSVSSKREPQSPQPLHGITRLPDARLRRMSVCLSTAQRATLPTSLIKARPFTGSLSDLHLATLSQDDDDEEQEQFLARYFTSTTTSSSLAQKTGKQLSNYSMRKRGASPHTFRRTSTSTAKGARRMCSRARASLKVLHPLGDKVRGQMVTPLQRQMPSRPHK